MDKNELVNKICAIEGLTNDEKSTLIELLRKQKKYGLVWEDKPEDVEERLREELPVLIEDTSKAIISTDTDAPNHILIEGDNLEALTALAYTHKGKVDVIYIDPPYNTGNKDFVYNDKFVDKEDAYRHSKWLSFMSKRLEIAKQLLSDNGVIFISIDDNEQAPLKMLCDEIFNENKLIGQIVWFKKRKGSFLSNKLISLTEYILAYSKNGNTELFGGLPSNNESQPIIKRTNSQKELVFPAYIVKTKLPNGVYNKGVYGNGTSASELIEDAVVENGIFVSELKIKAPFVWGQDFLNDEINNGTEIIVNTNNFQVRVIRHNNTSIKALPSFIDGREDGATNEDAYELLKSIFNIDSPFQYSKPVNLVKKLILSNSFFNKNINILDFFAGSGTTLHATMQLNAEDGGHRKCILVTNNENNICENVTYVRNKRVIQGYTTPKGEDVPGLTSNTLRYYRTDFVPREKTQKNMRALVAAATDMLCIKNDIYTETHEIGGAKMRPSLARHFKTGNNEMLIIYDDRAIPYIVDKLKDIDVKEPIMVYVFSPNDYPYTDEFFEVADKVKLCALPAAIYETYSKVLKRPKPHFLDEEKEKMVEAEKEDELDELFTTIDEEEGEA
ncbi:site-specific DNA-methyltransferase [Phocaeicola vulgatus]|nr:site-specific DNA-methyltransferase [Phocaeicola vulgatus]